MGVYDNAPARAARRMATTLAGVAALGLMAAGCGSSSDDSKGQATASPGAATTTSDGGTAGGAVVPGIRTLDELYKGTEEQPPASGPKAAPGKFVVWVSCGQITPGFRERFGQAYDTEFQRWVDAVRSGVNVDGPTAWDGYAAAAVCEAGVQSLNSGLPVGVQMVSRESIKGA